MHVADTAAATQRSKAVIIAALPAGKKLPLLHPELVSLIEESENRRATYRELVSYLDRNLKTWDMRRDSISRDGEAMEIITVDERILSTFLTAVRKKFGKKESEATLPPLPPAHLTARRYTRKEILDMRSFGEITGAEMESLLCWQLA